jgi:FKBP-type peptidyl-prolyl cis-trans isomerase
MIHYLRNSWLPKGLACLFLAFCGMIAIASTTHTQGASPMQTQTPLPAFLAKKTFTETNTGLRYHILTEGKGAKPSSPQTRVKVNYEGKLLDGTVFDSSYKRNEPSTFALNQVIPGWTQALMMMPVGSTWEVLIPANLAYGANGIPNVIPPNSTLYFKIELLEIL